jgi:hypothetical protein
MTFDELTRLLNADPTVKARRSAARTELQAIFNLIRGHFGIPALPVYLPMRKKIAVRGQARTCVGVGVEEDVHGHQGPQLVVADHRVPDIAVRHLEMVYPRIVSTEVDV